MANNFVLKFLFDMPLRLVGKSGVSNDSLNCTIMFRIFAVKDEVFCLFEGTLDNLGSLRQQYGLAKSANEAILVIEAYKALRDRAPYPPNHVVGHLSGNFAFIVFDKSTSTLFVASVSPHDQFSRCRKFRIR